MTRIFAILVAAMMAVTTYAVSPGASVASQIKLTTERESPRVESSHSPRFKDTSSLKTPLRLPGNTISAAVKRGAARVADESGVFFESFEYDDSPNFWREETADLAWLPEGWSRQGASTRPIESWFSHPMKVITYVPCHDGNYAMCILYSDEHKDEWLVTPDIEVGEGQYLTFAWYTLPLYMWVVDRKHVDFENAVFTDREIAATLKVMVSVDGGEWAEVKDLSDNFVHMGYDELMGYDPEAMMIERISLEEYAGHSVKIAFRYVGTDGNSIFVDAVGVNNGVEQLHALYKAPLSSMYVGGTVDGTILDESVQYHPHSTLLPWENRSRNSLDTNYSWTHEGLPVVDSDEDGFTAAFPIPSATASDPYELYSSPELSAWAEGTRSASFNENAYLMVGGEPRVENENFGVLPFDVIADGTGVHTKEPADFGQRGVPIFGYSDATDDFWRLYTCGGVEENLSHIPYAYVSGIINGIVPTSTPLVVNGAWLYAIGLIDETARLTCTIYSLDEDGAFDRVLATKTITGADVKVIDTRMNLYYYSIPFTFDAPAVLTEDGTDGGLYAIMISGFHDGGVEYFAPVMQTRPNRFEDCFGFYQIEFMYRGRHEVGLDFVASHRNDDGEEMYCAFTINLDAEYPWLESDKSEVALDGGSCEVKMRSFYGAADLSVALDDGSALPDWLKVEARGRFDNTVLTFKTVGNTGALDGDIVVSAPGVSRRLAVRLPGVSGDANGDGIIDASDIAYIVDNLLGVAHDNFDSSAADLNGDGIVDAIDISFIIGKILGE